MLGGRDYTGYYPISKQSLCAFLEVSGGAESRVQASEK